MASLIVVVVPIAEKALIAQIRHLAKLASNLPFKLELETTALCCDFCRIELGAEVGKPIRWSRLIFRWRESTSGGTGIRRNRLVTGAGARAERHRGHGREAGGGISFVGATHQLPQGWVGRFARSLVAWQSDTA